MRKYLERYSKPSQTSKMGLFEKTVNCWMPSITFTISSILNIWLGIQKDSLAGACIQEKISINVENTKLLRKTGKDLFIQWLFLVAFLSCFTCLRRPYPFKFFKGCLSKILLGPFLNTLSHTCFPPDSAAVVRRCFVKKMFFKIL